MTVRCALTRLALAGALAAAGCAFPVPGSAGLTQDPAGDGTGMLFIAYQATGTRNGQPATISRTVVNFGDAIPNTDRLASGSCIALRARNRPGIVFPAHDAGELQIHGGTGDFRCTSAGGTYGCDLPEAGGFFEAGAKLSLQTTGGTEFSAFTSPTVVPPRAPQPTIDLATLGPGGGPLSVHWQPSPTPVPMTCLQLESVTAEGWVNGFVQCDVDDADGAAQVPADAAAFLDPGAPVTRVALFSVDGSELVDKDGHLRSVFFGSGRFSEVTRP